MNVDSLIKKTRFLSIANTLSCSICLLKADMQKKSRKSVRKCKNRSKALDCDRSKIRSSLFLDELLNVFMLYVIIGKPLVVLLASDRLFH